MEHPALAAADGIVETVHVAVGQYVEAHATLVTLGAPRMIAIANVSGFYGDRLAAAREIVDAHREAASTSTSSPATGSPS